MIFGPICIFINHLRNVLYLIVLIGYSSAHSGSYEDFFTALVQDNPSKVQALLNRGFDPNTVDPNGVPGLLVAINALAFNASDVLVQWPSTKVEVRNSADESSKVNWRCVRRSSSAMQTSTNLDGRRCITQRPVRTWMWCVCCLMRTPTLMRHHPMALHL